jgi:hypothetical protein
MTEQAKQAPHIGVVAGNPTPEELAVVIAVVQAAAAAASSVAAPKAEPLSRWHRNSGIMRDAVVPGHGQWTASVRRGLN